MCFDIVRKVRALLEKRCWITSSQGNLRESATESKPPFQRVRVKGCGKSAPRTSRGVWQGKPHLKQGYVGIFVMDARVHGQCFSTLRKMRVSCTRRLVTDVSDK